MKKKDTKKLSATELREMKERGQLHYDAGTPVGEDLGKDFWDKAIKTEPKMPLKSVHLKLKPEIFDFYKSKGKGHLTKMQEILEAYANAHS